MRRLLGRLLGTTRSVVLLGVTLLHGLTMTATAQTGDFRVENYATGGIQNNNFLWRGYVFRPSRDAVLTGLWGGGGTNCNAGFDAAIFEVTMTGGGSATVPEYRVGTMLRQVDMRAYAQNTALFAPFAEPLTVSTDQFYLIAQGRVSSGSGCHYATTQLDFENLTIGSAIIAEWYPQKDAAYQPSGEGTGTHLVNVTSSAETPIRVLMGFRYDTAVEPAVIGLDVPAYKINDGGLPSDPVDVVVESTLLSSGGSGANDELTLYFEYATNSGFSGATLVPAAPFRVFGPQNNIPFGATLTGLSRDTTYWVRAVAINESGRVSGGAVWFTPQSLPTGFSVFGTVDGIGGSVTPATRVVIDGETTTFVAQPDPGYVLASMSGCGGSLEGLTFITGPITASCTVTARFAEEVTCDPATAPASVTVSSVGTSSATVSWTASTGEGPITYHWSVRRASDSVVVASGTSSATSVNASGLSPGTTYVAQVYASNCDGHQSVATSGTFTTASPVVGVLAHDTITYGADTTTVTASGGSGSGAYEFRQQGGTGAVSFAGTGASRTLTGTAAGSAPIEVRKLGDATYLDSPWVAAGTLTVAQRPVTVTADDVWKVYAEPAAADPALTWSLTDGTLAFADTLATVFSGAPTRASGEAVGTYAIGQGSLAANANYALTFVAGTLAIRHGPADHLVTVAPVGPQVAGVPFDLVSIVAVDRYGNVADGAHGATAYEGVKALAYALSGDAHGPAHGDDAFTTAVEFVAGVAVTPLATTLHRAQITTVTASAADLASPQQPDVPSAPFEVLAAAGTHLAFVEQPATVRAATPFALPPTVAVLDAFGNVSLSAVGSVAFELAGAAATLASATTTVVDIVAGVAALPCAWVDAPALGVRLHASSAGLASATSIAFDVRGALVTGVVYLDETAAGSRAPHAPGIADAIVGLSGDDGALEWPDGGELVGEACVALVTGNVLTDGVGLYVVRGVDAGTYTLEVGGAAVAGLARVGRDPFTVTAPAFGRYDGVDVGFFPGAFVDGTVFRDDGAGDDGVATDARRQPGERGLAGVTIRGAVGANAPMTAVSGAAGGYRLALPLAVGDAQQVSVTHAEARASGHSLGEGGDAVVTLRAASSGDAAAFQASAGETYRLDFGVLPPLRLLGHGERVSGSPGVASFTTTLQPGTPGSVALVAEPSRYPWTPRFHPDDTHCSGLTLGSPAPGTWLVNGGWPREPGDDRPAACRVKVDVHVPAGEPAGRVDDLALRAELTWSRPAGAPATSEASAPVRLRTTIIEGGRVALTFEASSDGGLTFHESVAAPPRWPVRYRIRFANTGAEHVQALVVRLPIADAYAVPPAANTLDAELRCPGALDTVVVALPYDAVTRSLALDLAAANTCGLDDLAPGASGELTLTLEIR